ncbi:hypothetical protein BP00DRAFT_449194 [Aspergillus indologenus CBS 114.80]|uniref:Uncharacterized protein n=1 Tax=Aspergillus indologenus CBS 114.80 TaxID=1450541 RepID=A0A2V5HVU9_9EURO|nr:hypothetical protein BP00DRAFT_449194 [Aspergillus indologenus CBS 114.80]
MRPDEAWETLDSSQTRSIARQLDSYLHQLRHLQGITFDMWITAKPSAGCERQFTAFILDDLVKLPDLLRHFAGHALTGNDEIRFISYSRPPRNILVEGDKVTAVHDRKMLAEIPITGNASEAMQHLEPMLDWPYTCRSISHRDTKPHP